MSAPVSPSGDGIAISLPFRPPFDAGALLDFLARRAIPGVEEVVGRMYRRSVWLPCRAGVVELTPAGEHVEGRLWLEDLRDRETAVERCRALLDLECDPGAVVAVLGRDPFLAPLVARAPGRRVPGHVDGHELALRAVLGQQVSLAAATTLTRRLVVAYGWPLAQPRGAVTHLFPSAAALADADPAAFAMPASRRTAVLGLARALANNELELHPGADHETARRRLQQLPGIGPWTVEYIAMRALRDPDAFLATDLGVRHSLKTLGNPGDPRSALALAERWRPYRAYAVQHLWAHLATAPAGHRPPPRT